MFNKTLSLKKPDKSKKGSIDKHIKKLVDLINSNPNCFTTSSCSGRIMLITRPKDFKKYKAQWIFISHDVVDPKDIIKEIDKIKKGDVWFRQEPFILHVCCKTIEDAGKLLKMCRICGLKRSGITSLEKRIIVEIMSTELIDTIVVKDGKKIVSDKYLLCLAEEANIKMNRNFEKIDRFCEELRKGFY